MSIQSEITRISGNVSDALTAIANKGVTVPSGSNSDDLATLIAAIETGGGGDEPVTPTETLLGTTPYTLLEDADIKLVGNGSYTYGVSAIDAEFADRENVTLSNTTLTDEGTYWQLADTGASAWYFSTANMYFEGLESGVSYTITVDSLGDGTTCTGGYWVIRDATGDNTYGVINPLAGTNTLTFTSTGTSINVFMATADSAYFEAGIKVARWTNMTITHTDSASGTDETLLGELKAGTTITASPAVQVYGITSGGGGGTVPTLAGKKCVCLGDSATALMDSPNDYPSVLASNTGMTVVNGGFSGCRMSDTHPTTGYKAFGAVPIADAIATGTWTTQDANISVFGSGANEANNLTALKAVDWPTVDYLTIFYGGNDAGNYVLPNNPSNPTDTTTYVGAARYVYNRIHTAYPNIKIIFFVPMYRYWLSDSKDSYQMTFSVGGNTYHYYDWGDALIASPPASGVPVIDMHRTLGIDSTNRLTYLLTSDQTHPSIAGCALIADKVEDEIRLAFIGGAGGDSGGGGSSATLITKTITQNGTYDAEDDSADGYSSVTVNIAGGASNIVTGTFKGTTTGAAIDVDLAYTGNGYPMTVMIYPKEGAYNSGGDMYNLVKRYSELFFVAIKNYAAVAPDYNGTGNEDIYTTHVKTKNSSSTANSYSVNNSANTALASGDGATASAPTCCTFKSKTKMSVFIAGSGHGFAPNIDYVYQVVYSS